MKIAVEVSLYPLQAGFVGPIKDFLERLRAYPDLQVLTNAMSTQISGEHAAVFAMLERETARTFEVGGRSVFVMKVLGGEARASA
jgi:uncharacterized protein YqgV (UPF0045/DUF77 family)